MTRQQQAESPTASRARPGLTPRLAALRAFCFLGIANPRGSFARVFPLFLIPGAACAMALTTVHLITLGPSAQHDMAAHARSIATAIAGAGPFLVRGGEPAQLQDLIGSIVAQNPGILLGRTFDASGSVVLDTRDHKGYPAPEVTGPFGDPQLLTVDGPDGSKESLARAPIFVGDQFWGGLDLVLRAPGAGSLETILWIWAAAGTGTCVTLWLLSKACLLIDQRTHRISQTLCELKSGNLAARSGFESNDELGAIAREVDALSVALVAKNNSTLQELQAMEERVALRTKALDALTQELKDLKARTAGAVG